MKTFGIVFVASQNELRVLRGDERWVEYFPQVCAKELNLRKLLLLQHLVSADEFENDAAPSDLRDESSIIQLHRGLASALAALDAEDLETVAIKWSQTEEFLHGNWPISDVRELLNQLLLLAKRARDMRKGLYLREDIRPTPAGRSAAAQPPCR